jgi:hypothetical protein
MKLGGLRSEHLSGLLWPTFKLSERAAECLGSR